MYVTLEPCSMCLGAIMQARIEKLYFGAFDKKTGVCGSCDSLINAKYFHHNIIVKGGVLDNECSLILKQFFKDRR